MGGGDKYILNYLKIKSKNRCNVLGLLELGLESGEDLS
jgi:hypothetical protein